MGSSQSRPEVTSESSSTSPTPTNKNTSSSTNNKAKRKPSPKNETGYDKATRICRKKKRLYDACYTAQLSDKEENCEELFEAYRNCFMRVMHKDMEKRGVKISENSMIGEYKEDIADEDDNI